MWSLLKIANRLCLQPYQQCVRLQSHKGSRDTAGRCFQISAQMSRLAVEFAEECSGEPWCPPVDLKVSSVLQRIAFSLTVKAGVRGSQTYINRMHIIGSNCRAGPHRWRCCTVSCKCIDERLSHLCMCCRRCGGCWGLMVRHGAKEEETSFY